MRLSIHVQQIIREYIPGKRHSNYKGTQKLFIKETANFYSDTLKQNLSKEYVLILDCQENRSPLLVVLKIVVLEEEVFCGHLLG